MKEKIGVIYTGGTIGMNIEKDGLTASGNFREKFLTALPQYKVSTPKLEFLEYEQPTDSSHASLQLAVQIYESIKERSTSTDTWLVLMGSDTLPYIAACLSYLLHDMAVSVIVTGAMKPLTAPQSDAVLNLEIALKTLIATQESGVHVVFAGEVLPAVRCTKLYASRDNAIIPTGTQASIPLPRQVLNLPQPNAPFVDVDIRVIRAAPSLHREFVRSALAGRPDAVLIECYGSGTAPAEDSEFGKAITELAVKGIPLFAISQTLDAWVDFSVYAASAWLGKLGIIRCGDMNLEAAYTKLWYLLNHNLDGEHLANAMQTNLCGEISTPKNIAS